MRKWFVSFVLALAAFSMSACGGGTGNKAVDSFASSIGKGEYGAAKNWVDFGDAKVLGDFSEFAKEYLAGCTVEKTDSGYLLSGEKGSYKLELTEDGNKIKVPDDFFMEFEVECAAGADGDNVTEASSRDGFVKFKAKAYKSGSCILKMPTALGYNVGRDEICVEFDSDYKVKSASCKGSGNVKVNNGVVVVDGYSVTEDYGEILAMKANNIVSSLINRPLQGDSFSEFSSDYYGGTGLSAGVSIRNFFDAMRTMKDQVVGSGPFNILGERQNSFILGGANVDLEKYSYPSTIWFSDGEISMSVTLKLVLYDIHKEVVGKDSITFDKVKMKLGKDGEFHVVEINSDYADEKAAEEKAAAESSTAPASVPEKPKDQLTLARENLKLFDDLTPELQRKYSLSDLGCVPVTYKWLTFYMDKPDGTSGEGIVFSYKKLVLVTNSGEKVYADFMPIDPDSVGVAVAIATSAEKGDPILTVDNFDTVRDYAFKDYLPEDYSLYAKTPHFAVYRVRNMGNQLSLDGKSVAPSIEDPDIYYVFVLGAQNYYKMCPTSAILPLHTEWIEDDGTLTSERLVELHEELRESFFSVMLELSEKNWHAERTFAEE